MTFTRRQLCSTLAISSVAGSLSAVGAQGEQAADFVIVGGGLGGCAAAIAALRNGLRVIMTEESDWIGGQLTSQGVPPDEHRWIETAGANQSYRELRSRIRDYYRDHYPLTDAARKNPALNPGNGSVSRLCCEPRVPLVVLQRWLAPFEHSGRLVILREHVAVAADVDRDRVLAVTVRSARTGQSRVPRGKYFADATELGDLLPLAGAEFVTGSEARSVPYVRESRRIKAEFTVLEEHVGRENRSMVSGMPISEVRAAAFEDSVGVGSYAIDLHPSTGGDNYIDFESLRFQIPLGSLLPVRLRNLLPACKNIGTTHITSGCYRLHPVEWGIGEAVGCLVSFALRRNRAPHAIRAAPELLSDFQRAIRRQGVEIEWKPV